MQRKSKGIRSVEVGYRLLACLERADGPMPLKDLARCAAMAPSQAHFYLSSYIRTGLVVQAVSGGHYDLGPSSLRLGLAALSRFDVVRAARESMFEIKEKIGGTVLLCVWGNLGPTVVYHLEGGNRSPLEGRVGTVLPALSAAGCSFLAFFPRKRAAEIIEAELSAPKVLSTQRIQSRKGVERILSEVRRHGVARMPGLYGHGFAALAAPIFDHEGIPRVTLTVLLDSKHAKLRYDGPVVNALLVATRRLSSEIGGEPRPNR
jgi:DNA-binding IclR family transcriptional regulator